MIALILSFLVGLSGADEYKPSYDYDTGGQDPPDLVCAWVIRCRDKIVKDGKTYRLKRDLCRRETLYPHEEYKKLCKKR